MTGRIVRYFAATAALTFIGVSAASAGWYGDDAAACRRLHR